jgi:hypothetical protein
MSLEKWVEYGWLKAEPSSPEEIRGLFGIVPKLRAVNGRIAELRPDLVTTSVTYTPIQVAEKLMLCIRARL